ncbi:uracil-DNA glycosylase family protein [Marinomonas epiphytica]
MNKVSDFNALEASVRQCRLCDNILPNPAKPILQIHPSAKILIAGQAPGQQTHDKGKPFDDQSGVRLRQWLGVTDELFYDPTLFAILPMSFCFPGHKVQAGKKVADLPPIAQCAEHWREKVLAQLTQIKLTLVLGQYAQKYHFDETLKVTEQVALWRRSLKEGRLLLPHPSPRNRFWLAKNPWFEAELIPELRILIQQLIPS